ncbi:MAG TPA: RNA polymerase sigma factor [Acidimicrobiales bacterium]|jgi:RNA polymerase sigma-70 factor (ECF subfamily)|nr:RNA polymerase sigma factor [Acidimicrobiales bacterium]
MPTATADLTATTAPPSAGPDGEDLLASVAASEEGAMHALWSRYARPVRRLATQLSGGDARDADDVVQETMSRVWRHAGSFDPAQGTEATFVFTIARRVIIDRWRRASRRVDEAELAYHPLLDSGAGHAFDAVLARTVVRAAVAKLAPRHREVIELAYFRGLTQAEIAERLATPLGTVKTRTFSALRVLRAEVGDVGLVA